MSTAEIRAYMYGYGLTKKAFALAGNPGVPLDPYWEVWPAEQEQLYRQLKPKRYARWVQQGVDDAAAESRKR